MGTGVASSTEKLSYLVKEALGLRICILARNLGEFLQKLLLLSSQIRRRFNHHPNVLVPSSCAAQVRNATPSQSKRLARLSPGRNLHLHFAVERRHFNLGSQGAWVKDTGTSQSTSVPSRMKIGCGRTCTTT